MQENSGNNQIENSLNIKLESGFLRNATLNYIVFILKCYSDKHSPMGVTDIVNHLNDLFPNYTKSKDASRKVVMRSLQEYYEIVKEVMSADAPPSTYNAFFVLYSSLGGYIHPSYKSKYYFVPIFDGIETSFINNSIIANHYLSEKHKHLILEKLDATVAPKRYKGRDYQGTKNPEQIFDSLFKELRSSWHEIETMDFHSFLEGTLGVGLNDNYHNINNYNITTCYETYFVNLDFIYEAITKGCMIKVTFGDFNPDFFNYKKEPKISFKYEINWDKTSILNPYSLLWNNGLIYLIATEKGNDTPVHYRVDYFSSVCFYFGHNNNDSIEHDRDLLQKNIDSAPAQEPVCREISKSIEQYYEDDHFNPKAYVRKHLMMDTCINDHKYVNCTLRTDRHGIALLYDYLGSDLKLKSLPDPDTDYDDPDESYNPIYDVAISEVGYENLKRFCTRYHDIISVVQPKILREEVISELKASIARLEDL